jgi:hypothetical protein
MPTKLRFLGLLLVATVAMLAQRAFTVAEVVLFVKDQIKAKGDDRATGEYLRKVKLTQRLDDRTIEDLQGQGAGPRTVAALKELAATSAGLPAAPPPAVVAAPPPPPKPPSAKEQAEILNDMREYALNYTNSLPNYVCVQTTHRKQEVTEMMHQKGYINNGDTIQELLTFYDHMETYKVEMVNGKSVTNVSHLQLGGVTSSGEFGSMMHDIFDPESGTQFAWENWHRLRDKRMYAFSYHVDKEHGYSMEELESHRSYTSAYKGLVYWDREGHSIPRITKETIEVPPDFPIHEVKITLDYDLVKIGEEFFMLPYHFLLTSRHDKANSTSEADYKLYRKYGAEATITFGDADPVPDDKLKDVPDKKDDTKK